MSGIKRENSVAGRDHRTKAHFAVGDALARSALTCWIEIVEPHNLAKHQPPGGYLLDNRQVQMTCAKSAGVYEWMELLRTEYHSGRKQLNCFSHEPSER